MGRTACTEPQCLYKGALYLYIHVIIVEIQVYPNKRTLLQYKVFIIKALEIRRVSTFCPQEVYINIHIKVLMNIYVHFPEDEPQRVETCQSSNALTVNGLHHILQWVMPEPT